MNDKMLLTPYFLDKSVAPLDDLAGGGWWVNKPALADEKQQARMAALYEPLADQVTVALREGQRPVSIAGDCCATLPVVAGLQRAGVDSLLIWLDAHGDFNTWDTTPSGFLGGMPLAWLVGRGEEEISAELHMDPFPESQVILSDARDLDPGEKVNVADSAVKHIKDVSQLDGNGRVPISPTGGRDYQSYPDLFDYAGDSPVLTLINRIDCIIPLPDPVPSTVPVDAVNLLLLAPSQ